MFSTPVRGLLACYNAPVKVKLRLWCDQDLLIRKVDFEGAFKFCVWGEVDSLQNSLQLVQKST